MFVEYLGERGDDIELCGMFLGDPVPRKSHDGPPRNLTLVELPNRSNRPEDAYVIRRSDVNAALLRLSETDDRIVGFWHTHPSPSLPGPSQADLDSITLGARHWWHAVWHPASRTVTWYDYDANMIVEIEKEHRNARRTVQARGRARMARVR